MLHQFRDRQCFADARRFDFDDSFARQNLDRAGGQLLADGGDGRRQRGTEIGSEPIVQGERIAFVLDENARAQLRQRGERALQFRAERRRPPLRLRARYWAKLGAVTADGGKLQRRKNQIDVIEQAAADQCERSAGEILQARKRVPQFGRHPDFPRGRCDIEDGAVDIKQDGALPQIGRERRFCDFHRQIGDVFLAPHVHIPSLFDKRQRPGDRLERFALRGDAPGRLAYRGRDHEKSAERVAQRNAAARSSIDQCASSKGPATPPTPVPIA